MAMGDEHMWWIWLCAAILVAVVILIFKRMPIELMYAASAKHKKQLFKVKIYNIDIIRDRTKKVKKSKKTDSTDEEDDEKKQKDEEFGFSQFMKQLDRVKDIYKLIKDGLEEVFSYLGKKTRCRNFTIHLDIGFESAAHTGIAGGAAYGLVYGAASMVYNNLDIKKDDMDIAVNPRFDKQCVDLYIKSIFRLSPAHIIKVVIMLLKINNKLKKTIKQ